MDNVKTSHDKVETHSVVKIPLNYVGRGVNRKINNLVVHTEEFFNDAFIPAIADKTSIQIYFGGAGSGKSVTIAERCILDMLGGERNFLVFRKVLADCETSFYSELKKAARAILGASYTKYFSFTRSPLRVRCHNGMMVIFKGLDKNEKVKSITAEVGIITDLILEEATELSEPDYEMIDTRLRGECTVPKRTTIIFNPIHRGHWLYERFFAGRFPDEAKEVRYTDYFPYTEEDEDGNEYEVMGEKSIYIHKSTHRDNRFLTRDDRNRYEGYKLTNPHMYSVYTLGNWGVLGDIIFPDFEKRNLDGVAKHFDHLYDGLDFGYFPDPYAYVCCGMRGDYIYVFLEESGYKKKTRNIAAEIKPHCGDRDVFCDTNDPQTMYGLQDDHGVNVHPVKKWKGNNETAIAWFHKRKIIVDYRCTTLIAQLEEYSYQKDKNGHSISKPCEGRGRNGHHDLISAMFYAFNYQIAGSRVTKIT